MTDAIDKHSVVFPETSSTGQSPRLWGIYPQRQAGLYMQRAKVRAGRLSPDQVRDLADIARRFTPEHPVHLTTRQDIEFHGVRNEDIRRIQRKIAAAGLTCIGACGDSLRNITVCPGAGICPGSRDVAPVADCLQDALQALPFIQNLPRKFKISFSGCEKACGLPWINDLGFVLRPDGTYLLLGAGSLGSPPLAGVMLSSRLLRPEIVAAAAAALRLFYRLGDRKNRHKARFRHVRERIGEAELLDLFHHEFRHSPMNIGGAGAVSLLPKNGFSQLTRLQIPQGDISPALAVQLADAAEQAGGELRIDLEHGVWLVTKQAARLPAELQYLASYPGVVSCPGAELCSRALTGCRKTAALVAERLTQRPASGLKIKFTGCPNNCSHAAAADIGLIGRLRSIDGARHECYKLVAGGGGGKSAELGISLVPSVPAERVPQAVDWLIGEYGRQKEVDFPRFVRHNSSRLQEALLRIVSPPVWGQTGT